jgi:formiminotetrahydrofolate cyclodeaminase
MAAALLEMVANLTVGRKRYVDVEGRVREIRDRAADLDRQARRLAQDDSDAYGQVAAAFKLPRDTDEQKEERTRRLQSALKGAVRPPLNIMALSSQVMRLAAELAGLGNRSAVSDVGTAALAARAAYHAARLNVDINLAAVRDAPWSEATREELAALENPDTLEQQVMHDVSATISSGA